MEEAWSRPALDRAEMVSVGDVSSQGQQNQGVRMYHRDITSYETIVTTGVSMKEIL